MPLPRPGPARDHGWVFSGTSRRAGARWWSGL